MRSCIDGVVVFSPNLEKRISPPVRTDVIWGYDLVDLYRYLWIYVDIYMEFGYLFYFLTGYIYIWIYIDINM